MLIVLIPNFKLLSKKKWLYSVEPAKPSTFGPHQQEILQCKKCNYKSTCKSDLLQHIHIHSRENLLHPCNICDRKFSRKGRLQRHIRVHSGEKPFNCEKPFHCNVCDQKFVLKSGLQRHLRVHSGKKLFRCNICNNKFADKSFSRRHVRSHSGEKPFYCNIIMSLNSQGNAVYKGTFIFIAERIHLIVMYVIANFQVNGL